MVSKFREISTDLLPLINVENWCPCTILGMLADFPPTAHELILRKSGLGS